MPRVLPTAWTEFSCFSYSLTFSLSSNFRTAERRHTKSFTALVSFSPVRRCRENHDAEFQL